MQPASSVAGAHCTGDRRGESAAEWQWMDDECSARAVCKKSMMKARNVPKGLVLATPNAGADKQTSSKQPRDSEKREMRTEWRARNIDSMVVVRGRERRWESRDGMAGSVLAAWAGQEQGTAESRTMGSQAHSCRLPAANRR